MLDLIIEAAITVAGVFLINEGVKVTTGKSIPQHLFGWWCELRDYLGAWLHENSHLGICRVGIVVLDAFDEVAVRTKQTADWITLCVVAEDSREHLHEVVTREVSREEALAQFPQLQETPVLVEELA